MSSDHRLVIEHMSDGLAFIDKHGRTGGGGLLQPVSEECKMEDPQAGWFGYDGGGIGFLCDAERRNKGRRGADDARSLRLGSSKERAGSFSTQH